VSQGSGQLSPGGRRHSTPSQVSRSRSLSPSSPGERRWQLLLGLPRRPPPCPVPSGRHGEGNCPPKMRREGVWRVKAVCSCHQVDPNAHRHRCSWQQSSRQQTWSAIQPAPWRTFSAGATAGGWAVSALGTAQLIIHAALHVAADALLHADCHHHLDCRCALIATTVTMSLVALHLCVYTALY
jgi:hypothetical protein